MDLGLKDKTVMISGSGRGIGLAIAKAFLQEGAKVLITDIDQSRADSALKELGKGAFNFVGDMTKADVITACVKKTLAKFGKIDIFIGNLGNGKAKPVLAADLQEWQKMLDINLLGTVEAVRQILPHMRRNRSGSIVLIASICGLEEIGAPAPYEAAKAALLAYAKSLSVAVAKDKIRVNAVAPGNIKFPGGRWEEIIKEKPEAVKEMLAKDVPLKRFGTPEEIANAVLFLASDKASFITGSCLVVDGGQSRGI